MLLKVKERLLVMFLLSTIKNALVYHWGVIRKMHEAVTFSDEEVAALHFESDKATGVTHWDAAADVGKDIEFSEVGLSIIRQALRDLSKKPLPSEWVALYDLFEVDILSLEPKEKEQCDG
jgi:hypothetical protein